MANQLDFAGGELRIDGFRRSLRHNATHGNNVLGANLFGFFVTRRVNFWTKYDLTETGAIAQVDEYDSAVIAPAMHPTHQGHFFAHRIRAGLAAVTAPLPIA